MKFPLPPLFYVSVLVALSLPAGQAQTWVPTAAGTTYDWNVNGNWSSSPFPNAAGAVANVNTDILGAQTIRLQQAITVGTLNLGDSNGTHTLALSTGGAGSLVFHSGTTTAAQLNLPNAGTVTNTISAPVSLTSDLNVNMGGAGVGHAQSLTLSGGITATGRALTFSGGFLNAGASLSSISITGNNNLIGNASTVITNNSNSSLSITGTQVNFTGVIVANGRAQNGNLNTLAMQANGSVLNASELVINGYLSAGTTQNGGGLQVGQGSSLTVNPGQRLTQNRITLNGGTLIDAGQALSGAAAGQTLQDTVANFDFHSGYSLVTLQQGSGSGGTQLNVTTLERTAGATGSVRRSLAGTLGSTLQFNAGNSGTFLKGAGGPEGSTTMSIIPWMSAVNASGGTEGFATTGTGGAGTTGIRALETSEYATSITAGSTANVAVSSVAIAGATTVNSLTFVNSGTVSNIGAGQILSVASGGVFFRGTNSGIGVAGQAAAGTLQFGSAEGVVWSLGTSSNSIGSVVAGSGGFTKAGTGSLTVTGANTYTGLTYVSAGTLVVGSTANLGVTGDVGVANGALLTLNNGNAISDAATLTIENFGLVNGMVSLAVGVNETVGGLYLGTTAYGAGTYGSTSSGATFQSDQWFSGSGMITVVPEPSTVALAGAGLVVVLVGFRRVSRAA